MNITVEEVIAEIKERDQRDISRDTDPLQIVPKAWVLDTSHLEIEEVVDLIIEKVKQIQKNNE